jgi:hypothetical protein
MPSELRWMVFKVKQRANGNYFKKVFSKDSNLGDTETKRISRVAVDQFGNTMDVQYNWPYDYFSLVELVKLEAEVEFNNADFTNFKETLPKIESVKAQPFSVNMMDADLDEKYIAFAETDDYTPPGNQDDPTPGGPQSGAGQQLLEQLEEDFADLQASIVSSKIAGTSGIGDISDDGPAWAQGAGVDVTVGGSIVSAEGGGPGSGTGIGGAARFAGDTLDSGFGGLTTNLDLGGGEGGVGGADQIGEGVDD